MINIKLIIAFMNKKGWDPSRETAMLPGLEPGGPLGHHDVGPVKRRVKIIGDGDFNDKLFIYKKSMASYIKEFSRSKEIIWTGNSEFLCRAVAKDEHRGIVVVVLENTDLLYSDKLTKIKIPSEHRGAESDQTHIKLEDFESGTLPPAPQVVPPPTLDEVTSIFGRFAEANPEQAREAAARCQTIANDYIEYDLRRILTAQRAEEVSGLSRAMLTKLGRDGVIGEFRKSQWFFSGRELDWYQKNRPKRGPKPKASESGEE